MFAGALVVRGEGSSKNSCLETNNLSSHALQGQRLASLFLSYERRGLKGDFWQKDFKAQVWQNENKEKLTGLSLYGAHRDDFILNLNGQDSRYFCSQGQQRGLILTLKIAQILWLSQVIKASPLLLLDDIFSEIDNRLLLNLLQFLEDLPVQTILTSTREPLCLNKRAFKKLYLKAGVLKEKPYGHRQREDSALL